jgi:hypothetical protein
LPRDDVADFMPDQARQFVFIPRQGDDAARNVDVASRNSK